MRTSPVFLVTFIICASSSSAWADDVLDPAWDWLARSLAGVPAGPPPPPFMDSGTRRAMDELGARLRLHADPSSLVRAWDSAERLARICATADRGRDAGCRFHVERTLDALLESALVPREALGTCRERRLPCARQLDAFPPAQWPSRRLASVLAPDIVANLAAHAVGHGTPGAEAFALFDDRIVDVFASVDTDWRHSDRRLRAISSVDTPRRRTASLAIARALVAVAPDEAGAFSGALDVLAAWGDASELPGLFARVESTSGGFGRGDLHATIVLLARDDEPAWRRFVARRATEARCDLLGSAFATEGTGVKLPGAIDDLAIPGLIRRCVAAGFAHSGFVTFRKARGTASGRAQELLSLLADERLDETTRLAAADALERDTEARAKIRDRLEALARDESGAATTRALAIELLARVSPKPIDARVVRPARRRIGSGTGFCVANVDQTCAFKTYTEAASAEARLETRGCFVPRRFASTDGLHVAFVRTCPERPHEPWTGAWVLQFGIVDRAQNRLVYRELSYVEQFDRTVATLDSPVAIRAFGWSRDGSLFFVSSSPYPDAQPTKGFPQDVSRIFTTGRLDDVTPGWLHVDAIESPARVRVSVVTRSQPDTCRPASLAELFSPKCGAPRDELSRDQSRFRAVLDLSAPTKPRLVSVGKPEQSD